MLLFSSRCILASEAIQTHTKHRLSFSQLSITTMHRNIVLLAFAAAVHGQSLGLSDNDVPPECRSICQPVIDGERVCCSTAGAFRKWLTSDSQRCDTSFDDDSQQYRDCVCQDQAAAAALSPCEQCAAQYPNFFIDNDNDGRGRNGNQGPDIDDNGMSHL